MTTMLKTSTRDAIMRELKAAREIAGDDVRDLSADERARIATHVTRATELRKSGEEHAALAQQLTDLTDGVGLIRDDDEGGPPAIDGGPSGGSRRKSIGRAFIDSPEYQGLIKAVPDGRFPDGMRVQSAPFAAKDLVMSSDPTDGAGLLVQSDRRGILDPISYARPLTIRDLVTKGTTQSDTIEYVRLTAIDNQAAPVKEATSAAFAIPPAAGAGVKPESGLSFEKATATVKTLAHWLPATRRALSDVGQIRTLIDDFLKYGLEEALENQIIDGDGTGENLDGLNHTSNVQVQAAPGVGETILDTTRKARTKVRIVGRATPTAYAMNPVDWEAVELLKDAQDHYYGAGPFALTAPRLWGLPVVESEAVPAGTAYCGDWTKAILYDREQASIQVTDSHADFFVRNLVAILAELRAAFAVIRPAAFVKIDVA
jgi:HK97 family phage major capsid protein